MRRGAFFLQSVRIMGSIVSSRENIVNVKFWPDAKTNQYKGLTYDGDGVTIVDSLFQRIADGDVPPGDLMKPRNNRQNELLYQDEQVAAFYTMDPGCDQGHILVVPRARQFRGGQEEFLKSCLDLKSSDKDVALLQHMKNVGEQAMMLHRRESGVSIQGDESIYFYFHVPPFTSIDHLHLHVIGSDKRNSFKNYLKYPPWCETIWCVRLETVLSSLEADMK
jgi:diadenosine tetraphosphate (Ap4A) HIT family hydrolase